MIPAADIVSEIRGYLNEQMDASEVVSRERAQAVCEFVAVLADRLSQVPTLMRGPAVAGVRRALEQWTAERGLELPWDPLAGL